MVNQDKVNEGIGKRLDDSRDDEKQRPQEEKNRGENFCPENFSEKAEARVSEK